MIDTKRIEASIVDGIGKIGSPEYPHTHSVSVSSIGFCMRKTYLSKILHRPPQLNGAMLYGKLFHYALPEILEDVPEFTQAIYDSVVSIPLNHGTLVGHPDIITPNMVWEVKTASIQSLKFNAVPQSYYIQANTYAGMYNLDAYGLIIVDSDIVFKKDSIIDDSSVVVIVNEFDEPVYEMCIDFSNEIDDAIYNHPSPFPVEFTRKCPSFKVECKTCPVRDVCRRIYGGEEGEDSS